MGWRGAHRWAASAPIVAAACVAAACVAAALPGIWAARGGPLVGELGWLLLLAIAVWVGVTRGSGWAALAGLALADVLLLTRGGGRVVQGAAGVGGSLVTATVFLAAGARLTGGRSAGALVAGLVVGAASVRATARALPADYAWEVIVCGILPWCLGRIVREREQRLVAQRSRVARATAGRERHIYAALVSERSRLAREIHDVVAHHVSVMVIQAGGARAVMSTDTGMARAALAEVQRAAAAAIAELSRLSTPPPAGATMRGVADLDGLCARVRATGLEVSCTLSADLPQLPEAVGHDVYRVIQEALTNTVRHAGARRVDVLVAARAGRVEVTVRDDGRGTSAPSLNHTGGSGLRGIRERASRCGGAASVETRPGHGFMLAVTMPVGEGR